jgi:hypothetical protein
VVLKRLGLTELEATKLPPISGILVKSRGGMEVVESAIRLSDDPVLKDFFERWHEWTKRERDLAPIEAFAKHFGIDCYELLKLILIALREYSATVVKVTAITGHPGVIDTQIERAMTPDGERDRAEINKAMGFTPRPKGPTFIGTLHLGKGEGDGESQKDEEPDLDFLFPGISETQKRLPQASAPQIAESSVSGIIEGDSEEEEDRS